MSAADPFYLVKEEIDESVKKVEGNFETWEKQSTGASERASLKRDLLAGIESVEWQVNELDKAIAVAERDPSRFGIDAAEIGRRRKWSTATHDTIDTIRKALHDGRTSNASSTRRELMRMEDDRPGPKANRSLMEGNDDFLSLESERQALILKDQDEDLDEISASVVRIGDVGLTIHEELSSQEKIVSDLDKDMDGTANRMELAQKRLAHVLKKAGLKGQLCLIAALVILLMILTLLVFFT
ncbi:hypothetical protein SELMODRAFT_183263 [Selaginella moellendorffii]|uniref:t-SNARE coiled-coil homology domain-containing protein n=1 Tax=Selaginella moellendorffii TaxID=88036 RepID=D8SW66_SELML|nr:syntaxin-61 [Selaginella moellendorffii]EFJ11433.1 hypothetical protein SELMODRAFT_183263 [Selaginella moellendorffii]|eukprot:XP_002987597.1 syntaxin-61 [Selaginella moellendorffii]